MKRDGNRLLALVQAGRVPLGMQCFTGHPALIEILGGAGFDFVMFDTEHSGTDPRAMENLIRAAECARLIPLVRVPENDAVDIRRALEAGAEGVIVPQIGSAAAMKAALDAARFPPAGTRGMCPSTRASGYTLAGWNDYVAWNDAHALVVPLIETPEGVANIEDICAVEGVRAVCFGPGDYGQSIGAGLSLFDSAEVWAAFERVVAAARRRGIEIVGFPLPERGAKGQAIFTGLSPEACRRATEMGIRIFLVDVDQIFFRRHAEALVRQLGSGLRWKP